MRRPCLLPAVGAGMLHATDTVLTGTGPEKKLAFTAAGYAALPPIALTASDPHPKADRHLSGVTARELPALVGVPWGDKLREPALPR